MKYKNHTVSAIYLNGEQTKYVVSKKGRIFNTKSGKELKHKIDSKGYLVVTLSHKGVQKDMRVHRLVALGFVKNPNKKKFTIVNHLDGNKQNPYYKNLEWTDYSGNVRHAITNGLTQMSRGEKHGKAVLKDADVHKICKIMETGLMTQREIAKKFKVDESVIHEIRLGHNWKHISNQYEINNCKLGQGWSLPDDVVLKICNEILKDEMTIKEISRKYNIKYDIILGILNKKTYKHITHAYNFDNYSHRSRYSEELMSTIRNLIISGKTNKEIREYLNLEKGAKTNTMLYRERQKINNMH